MLHERLDDHDEGLRKVSALKAKVEELGAGLESVSILEKRVAEVSEGIDEEVSGLKSRMDKVVERMEEESSSFGERVGELHEGLQVAVLGRLDKLAGEVEGLGGHNDDNIHVSINYDDDTYNQQIVMTMLLNMIMIRSYLVRRSARGGRPDSREALRSARGAPERDAEAPRGARGWPVGDVRPQGGS